MKYQPRQGDIVWIDFNPQSGHEQKGRRPALIVWNDMMLQKIPGMSQVCAISHTDNGFPLHVSLDSESTNTQGYVMCEQNRVLDLEARNVEYKDHVSKEVLKQVLDILVATIENADL